MADHIDPVNVAFSNAIRDFKTSLGDEELFKEISTAKSIDDVYDATDALQKEQRLRGRLRHLEKIQPYLEQLRSYAAVIEVFVQAKQDVLALIWGPIKLLLYWADNMRQAFDALVDTLADIGFLLPEFQNFGALCSDNKNVKDVLVLFFRDILDFYLILVRFFRRSSWRLIFDSMWTKQQEKIKLVRAQIRRHSNLLTREVRWEHIQDARNAKLQALEFYEMTEKTLRRQEYLTLSASISLGTYQHKLDSLNARVCPGTGQWLLKDAIFAKWLDVDDDTTRVLWLQGIPGAGKTYLSATVVQKTKKIQFTGTVYAFLSYAACASLSALSIIHTLIFQLASGNTELQDILCQSNEEGLRSNLKAASEILKSLLLCAEPSYMVIDGVDEIDQFERCRLLNHLGAISTACPKVKILISSRAEDDIAENLKHQIKIRVDNRNAGSIQLFVNQRTKKWLSDADFVPEARTEIQGLIAPLASRAKGMFLYAEVVLNSICALDDMGDIREELRALPEDLDDAYSRILHRINRLKDPQKDRARKILGWVACAPIPLTLEEIEQALIVIREDVRGNGKVNARLNIPKICGPIVEVADDGYVQFVHFTVKEYFFSSRIDSSLSLADAKSSLAICCVTYLCQAHHDPDLPDNDIFGNIHLGAYRLHNFAMTNLFGLIEDSIANGLLSDELTDVLEKLRSERTNCAYIESCEASDQTKMNPIRSNHPELYNLFLRMIPFNTISQTSSFNKGTDISWTSRDPLTISTTSIRVYQQFELMHCQNRNHQDCHCDVIKRHYGQRPFKCGFLSCSFSRHGFASRRLQKSHMNHHDRPWKCSVPTCEYAEGGFLSKRMRDHHLQNHATTHKSTILDSEDLDMEEIQPLLFDLIKADKVCLVRKYLTLYDKSLPARTKDALLVHMASFGSLEMVDLMKSIKGQSNMVPETKAAVRALNIPAFKSLISEFPKTSYQHAGLMAAVIKSDSSEIWQVLDQHIDAVIKSQEEEEEELWARNSFATNVIATTIGSPDRETLLIALWEKFSVKTDPKVYGSGLVSVASSTCSVKLAKYLLNLGAEADFRRSTRYLTPLHHAARHDSAASAQLMELLLLHKADPEAKGERAALEIRDEKGARGTSKWLGISWDELVARTKGKAGVDRKG